LFAEDVRVPGVPGGLDAWYGLPLGLRHADTVAESAFPSLPRYAGVGDDCRMGVHRSQSAYPPDRGAEPAPALYRSGGPDRSGGPAGGGFERWLIPGALVFLVLAVLFGALMLGHVLPLGGGAPAAARVPDSVPAGGGAVASAAAPPSGLPPSPTPAPPPSPTPSPTPPANGSTVRSAVSGLCLDVDGDPANQGTPAAQEPCTGDARQRWRQVPTGAGFALVDMASGLCLDVAGVSTDDGAPVQVWGCNGGPNQQWRLQPVNGNLGLLVAAHSNKCLDVPAQQQSVPTHLQQWTCLSGTNQQWSAAPA
jgi:Ricin-type beta-trefoil lectin domain